MPHVSRTVTVRTAEAEDAEAIGRCQLACWRETYSHLVAPDFFDRYGDGSSRGERWQQILAMDATTALAVAPDGVVVGFSSAGPPLEEPAPRSLEVYAIYLLAAHHGSGVGDQLMTAVADDRPAQLWVLEDNPRARAFYAKHGFRADGTAKTDPWTGLTELRMVRG